MAYHLQLGQRIVAQLGPDNTVNYDMDAVRTSIKEIVAGQGGKGAFFTTARVVYRWDKNRKTNNDAVFNMWKANPLVQNRIVQMNSLVFGRGLTWIYDDRTQSIIDRFWRTNRLRGKLGPIGTDVQLYGEIFIGLFPQPSGDVKIGLYEANQVDIDFNPANVDEVNKYIISYKDEESGKDESFEMMPLEKYLNDIEYSRPITAKDVKRKGALGLNGQAAMKSGKGVMVHIKFNNSTSEVYGTSDFKQVFDIIPDYMNFVGDRLAIHQLYGSPAWDITIDTEDPEIITQRIDELAGFTIGSNPVHNKQEEWKPLQFTGSGVSATEDEKVLRGLVCAGMSFPEHLLFNQTHHMGEFNNTFAVTKVAEDRQEKFTTAFSDIHKYVMAIAGDDPSVIDDGQIVFPEINTMSEKTKAETYVLKVGSNICSCKTAANAMGYNWDLEQAQIIAEMRIFGALMQENPSIAGMLGGRFSKKSGGSGQDSDDGSDDKESRQNAENVSTQVMGDHKTND